MNLKNLFMLLFILNTVAFIFVAILIDKYQKSTLQLEEAYKMQYKSLILAQELRQSSDDLTRMARTYVITGNTMFEEQFKTVLDIRNGDKSRPKRYNGIFWDFYTLGEEAKFDGEKIALKELMKQSNFLESELSLLLKSQRESDDLTNLEKKAMNAIKGIFQDEKGEYKVKGKPDYKLAREIMHSDEYHKAKIRIMKPLDQFYRAFETRTKQRVEESRQMVKKQEFYVNVVVLFSVILFLMSFFIILFRIIYPIDFLRKAMKKLSSNDMSVELDKNKYQDEIGDMIGSVKIFKDNTKKLIESEHQIKLAIKEVTSANKAKSTFLARMSHELRTPLNAILGFASLLKKSKNISEQESKNIDVIKRSGKHLLNIINEILELSKIEAGKVEITTKPFELYNLIDDIESMFDFRCESKGLIFNLKVNPNLPNIIKADEQRLRQILINLLSNSLKFTNEGSISLNIYEHNKKIFFEVKDTGIGIDKSDLKKIFKPFEQIRNHNYTNGTGLGLSITKELVSLMGGDIYVKSFVGRGSEFYFNINFEESSKEYLEDNTTSNFMIEINSENKNKSILVVDDIKENRDLLVQILSQYKFKIYEASSGKEAIELCKNNNIDLIFMDILMNGLDGLETTQIIRNTLKIKDLPIIVCSANVYEDDKQIAYKKGANDFLAKPLDEKELMLILQKYLDIGIKKEKVEQEDNKNRFDKFSKEFCEKLMQYSISINNDEIEKLIKEFNIDTKSSDYIKLLIEEFDYQKIVTLCEKRLKEL